MSTILQSQFQKQSQKQVQRLSHLQIQSLKFLEMSSDDVYSEIKKALRENPALKIVKPAKPRTGTSISSDVYQQALEANEDKGETLQSHLMHQLNSMNISDDERELSEKLIYNLDKNGFYGSMISPENFLNKARPVQNRRMLEKCINRIQQMDPVGTCCKTPEESLFVQAKLNGDAPSLTLFLLDNHLDMLNPPDSQKVYRKIKSFQEDWHKKAFATPLTIDNLDYSEKDVQLAITYILKLNPHPAQGYSKEANYDFEQPDIVLEVERKNGYLNNDDFEKGLIAGDGNYHFQVKYASGVLPEIGINPDFAFDKNNVAMAQELIQCLAFRQSSIVLQGCAIVKAQKDFFLNGVGHINVLTRKEIARELGIHESTVSRMSAKNSSKYIQTQWGTFPASYFFSSGVSDVSGKEKISAEAIKQKIQEIISSQQEHISDSKLTEILNEQGIKIARRTVAKYRSGAGIENSYRR